MIPNELLAEVVALITKKVEEEFNKRGVFSQNLKEQDVWMNQKSAAAYAGVCVNTLKTFENQGMKVFRNGGKVLISKSEIDRYLKKHSR